MSLNEGSKNPDLKNKLNEAKEAGLETKELVSLLRGKIEAILGKQNNPEASSTIDSSKTEKSPDQIKQVLDSLKQKIENQSSETDDYVFNQIQEELSNLVASHPESYQVLTQAIDQAVADKNNRPILKSKFASLIKQKQGEKEVAEKEKQSFKEMADQQYEKFKIEKDLILKSLEDKSLESEKEKLQGEISMRESNIALNFEKEEIIELYGTICALYDDMKVDSLKKLTPYDISNLIKQKEAELQDMIPEEELAGFNQIKEAGLNILSNINSDRKEIERLRQSISELKPAQFSDEVVLDSFLAKLDLPDSKSRENLKKIFQEKKEAERKEKDYPKLVQTISSRMVFDKDNLVKESYDKFYRESEKKISKLKNDFDIKQKDLQDKMTFETYQKIFDVWGFQQGSAIKFNPRDVKGNLAKDEKLKDDPVRREELENEIRELEKEAKSLNEKIQSENKKIEDSFKNINARKNGELREQDLEMIAKILEPEIPEGKYEDLREALKKELKCGWAKEPFIGFARRLEINQAPAYSGYSVESEVKEMGTELLQKIAKINDNDEKESIINSWKEKVISACSNQEGKSAIKDEATQANLNKLLDAIVFLAKQGNLDLNQLAKSPYQSIDQSLDFFNQSFARDYYVSRELEDIRKSSELIKKTEANLKEVTEKIQKYNLTETELQKSFTDRRNIESEQDMLKELMRSSNIDKESLNKFISKYNERFGTDFSKAGLFSNPGKVFESLRTEAESKYKNLLDAIRDLEIANNLKDSIGIHKKHEEEYKEKFIGRVLGNFTDLASIKDKMYYFLSKDGQTQLDEISIKLIQTLRWTAGEIADNENTGEKELNIMIRGLKNTFVEPVKELIEREIYTSDNYKRDKEKAENIQLIRSVKSFKDLADKKVETA